MNRTLLIALATACLFLVPASVADGPGPSGLPIPLPGQGQDPPEGAGQSGNHSQGPPEGAGQSGNHSQGPPEHSNAGGNGSAGNGSPSDDGGDDGASGNATAQASAAAFRHSCRLIGWDGGDIEPRIDPVLGVIIIDPDGCGYGILDRFPPR